MARKPNVLPSYLLHKASGQARCRINGRDIYLGDFGSVESRKEYARIIGLHAAGISIINSRPQGREPQRLSSISRSSPVYYRTERIVCNSERLEIARGELIRVLGPNSRSP